MTGFITRWRRRRAIANSGIDDELWSRVARGLPFLRGLPEDDLQRLRNLVAVFLNEKTMDGAGGLELTNDIRLSIAMQACLPILNLGIDAYAGWVGIIVYPGQFMISHDEMDEDGVMHHVREEASGEAWEGGPVVLSWQDAAMTDAGYNVVIHEFAHKLDMAQGEDDLPRPRPGMDADKWAEVLETAFNDFCAEVERHDDETLVDPYAAEHPAEFFAVMSEMFFTHSAVLARDWPELYEQFTLYYRQDPAGIFDGVEPASKSLTTTR